MKLITMIIGEACDYIITMAIALLKYEILEAIYVIT